MAIARAETDVTNDPGRFAVPDRVDMHALRGLPLVEPGDDLAALIVVAFRDNGLRLRDDDIVVIAHKVVSKAEGRVVSLADVRPSAEALERARMTDKDPALVQLILDESNEVLRQDHNVIIVEHRLGFVMANAGVDQSNCRDGEVVLVPEDPDASARRLAAAFTEQTGASVGVVVIDSVGRAWRNGIVGHALGIAGIVPLLDRRETPDLFGRPLQVTHTGLADQIAAGASALMGEASEAKPVVLVRGFVGIRDNDASIRDLLRDKHLDLFR